MTTQELTQAVIGLKTTVSGMDERMTNACIRLDVVEKEVKEQGKLLQSIDRLASGLARLDEKMGDLSGKMDIFSGRINTIELRPARKWEQLSIDIIRYIVLAGIGFLAATLVKGV